MEDWQFLTKVLAVQEQRDKSDRWKASKIKEIVSHAHESREDEISKKVLAWINLQNGYFNLQVAKHDLHLLTPPEVNNLHQIMHRLMEKEIIEPYGKWSGVYRRVDKERKIMEWWESDATPVDIKFPLLLNSIVDVYPSSIILVAGKWNAGKSAYCMATAMRNHKKLDHIDYLISEMSPNQFFRRFEATKEYYKTSKEVFRKKVEVVQRQSADFVDVIDPAVPLTIIDYMKAPMDEVYLAADWADKIYQKLQGGRGVVLMAMQKPKGRDEAYGGEPTAWVPSVYLALNDGQAKMIKAKDWKEGIDKTGFVFDFSIRDGCIFELDKKGWYVEAKPGFTQGY